MIIGLTGGIASGKSTVANLFAERGADVIDADRIAREVVEPGTEAYKEIIGHFGQWVVGPEGKLNRRVLRDIVFADAKERAWLENLLHPLIRQQLNHRAEISKAPYCLLVIPLLTDRSQYPHMQRILVIDSPEHLQLKRVQTRDNIEFAQAEAMLKAQSTREARLALADDVIVNDGDWAHLAKQVESLHQNYLSQIAHEPKPSKS